MRCPLNIFWPLYLKVAKLGTVYILRKPMDRIYFQITTSKINVKLILLFKWYSLKIFWPFCFTIIKLRTLDTHSVSMTLLIFRSQGERSRSNCYSLYRCCPLIIFWPLAWNLPNLVQWMSHVVPYWPSGRIVKSQDLTGGFKKNVLRSISKNSITTQNRMTFHLKGTILLHWFTYERRLFLLLFGQKVKMKLVQFISALSNHYFMSHLRDLYQIDIVVSSGEWIMIIDF